MWEAHGLILNFMWIFKKEIKKENRPKSVSFLMGENEESVIINWHLYYTDRVCEINEGYVNFTWTFKNSC